MILEDYKRSKLVLGGPAIIWRDHYIMEKRNQAVVDESIRLLLEKVAPVKILEVGYGNGLTARLFKAYGAMHHVVEVHPQIAQKARQEAFNVSQCAIQDFDTDEAFDLIYDDHYPFPGIPKPDFSKIAHTHYATVCQVGKVGPGFSFQVKDRTFFQPLT